MYDFSLYLPENTGMSEISVVPSFDGMNPLMQRAVCLLLFHDDPQLRVNGMHIINFLNRSNVSNISGIAQMFTPVADRLSELMNEDSPTVSSIVFELTESFGKIQVNISIKPEPESEDVEASVYTLGGTV